MPAEPPLPPYPPIFSLGSHSVSSLPSSDEEFEEKDRFEEENRLEDGDYGRDQLDEQVEGEDETDTLWATRQELVKGSKPARTRKRICLAFIVLFAILIGTFAASSWTTPLSHILKKPRKHLTLDHVTNGTFAIQRKNVAWVKEAEDGTIATQDEDGNIFLDNVNQANSTKLLINSTLLVDEKGNNINFVDWKLSPDLKYLSLQTDRVKQWRHSSHSKFYIHSFESNKTFPLVLNATVAYASWSTVGHGFAYVSANDLYVLPEKHITPTGIGKSVRVTLDGSPTVFNGVPDWVYEEEIFGTDFAFKFSPSGQEIVYLRFDETDVPEYEFPIYDPDEDLSTIKPYPKEMIMKYPKPGYPNPLVTAHVFSLSYYESKAIDISSSSHANLTLLVQQSIRRLAWPNQKPSTDQIIFDLVWVNKTQLLIKETDRSAASGNVVLFEIGQGDRFGKLAEEGVIRGNIVRSLNGGKGWLDHFQYVVPYGQGYLDVIPNSEGFNHIAFFPLTSAAKPVWITEGNWEVDGEIKGFNEDLGIVYFTAANPSTERHLYSATLPLTVSSDDTFNSVISALTDSTRPSYHTVSFSPKAGFYVLSYEGPDVPWQKIRQTSGEELDYLLEDNKALNETLNRFIIPSSSQYTILSDGFELNVKEIRPPNMDESGRTKYPVLLAPYGGPVSQMVNTRFAVGWADYLATELKYIVLIVDGRGTGFKGKAFRDPIRGQLGTYEAIDQIAAARQWAGTKLYVDKRRVGIWGWSFGGYLTAKVIEADSGVISLGISVAPVTDWKYYDSVYTERYMLTPEQNQAGYAAGGVNNMTGFQNVDYLLAHGSGDDNVHLANSASLLEKLTRNKVRKYQFRMFTDSAHSISRGGAYRELFEFMTQFLIDKWGYGGRKRG
ncbi:dipeptidyl aminopeptidase [Phaffia rhodozyma]|uniref:Dipeptidyl aminopeptidase n=1 Tax=Phaffia rhodozyma TaxID=264483 RepID=A0A0F7SJY1_PHARH|nr:dipeptidyl aminopeptidase [Phaffia rhodozyma]